MTRPRLVQSLMAVEVLLLIVILGALTFAGASIFSRPQGSQINDPLISETAYWPVWLWCLGSPIVLGARWPIGVRVARLLFTAGWLALLLHLGAAFHLGHGWSQSHAYQHVEELSGFGPGLYVNYVFAAIWLADVAWMWANLGGYLKRSRWLSGGILLFMAFIVFYAAIVFGHGPRRIVSAVHFVIPLTALGLARPPMHKPGQKPGSHGERSGVRDHSPT